jgi:tRNA A-37 threonylcarbamoyl transferase component Bud32
VKAAKPLSAREFLHVHAPAYLRRTQGRETFAWGADVIVKRTLERARSGLWPWFRARSAGEREYAALRALAAAEVSVPAAFGYAEERRDGGRLSVCVMERVAHDETLRAALERASGAERRELARALLALVARFHGAGFIHRDLYLQHVLLRATDGELVLIDVGRARRRPMWRSRWYVKDLASLLHSTPGCVKAREKLAFLAGWLDVRGIKSRGARRRFAAAILRKARRIAAHVPRDERGGAR